MPPANPAPSPAGYSPSTRSAISVSRFRGKRTGDDKRVSTPVSSASGMRKAMQLPIHPPNAELQVLDDEIRQTCAQIRRHNARTVGRLHVAKARRGAVVQQIFHTLHRRFVPAAAKPERHLLNAPLPHEARQRVVVAKVLRTHAHQQRTVRVFARARVVAHAVDAQTIRLTCRRNHLAARTHAEGVCSAAVGRMDGKLVVCRLQRGVRPAFAVLALADERLRMLNAHTHGEWLLLHAHALPEQRRHGVARAVTDGENHRVGADFLCFAAADAP